MTRIILETLRTAGKPLTARDLAIEVLTQRGLNPDDQWLLRIMIRRAGASLIDYRKWGLATSCRGRHGGCRGSLRARLLAFKRTR